MIVHIEHLEHSYKADLHQPLDISIPLRDGMNNPNCFYAPYPEMNPVKSGDFIGSTAQGGLVNFFNVKMNPHGNGTHTECVGHIAHERHSILEHLQQFHFIAKLVSLYPIRLDNGDRILSLEQVKEVVSPGGAEALVIRTLPNEDWKLRHTSSGTNPPYVQEDAIHYLVDCGIQHLLVDLPSVDREEDEGKLLAHRAFWKYPDNVRKKCTISELIYVHNDIKDGLYLLNLQIMSLDLDASPSKPILYTLF